MRNLTHQKWMKPSNLLLASLMAGSVALAETPARTAYDGLGDPHLAVLPRTAAEAARIASVTAPTTDFSAAQRFESRSAGAATVRVLPDANAFSQPSANITFEDELEFKLGNGLFRKLWVSSPSSTLASDGLGPLFNARSCQRCHIKDGRGHPPENAEDNAISMFLRISIMDPDGVANDERLAEIADYIATLPDPNYGTQMQDFAVQGFASEYSLGVTYTENIVELADGTEVSLRAPTYTAENLGYGPLANGAMLSPRVAPQMIGLGLLEAIPAADILANADPDDLNNDGISGRPNIVWSVEYDQPMLGRFGLKAGNPTIMQQSAGAFAGDIGISNPLFPAGSGECTANQTRCLDAIHGNDDVRGTEIDAVGMELVTFYSRNLGVPARRDVDAPQVFGQAGTSKGKTRNEVLGRDVEFFVGAEDFHHGFAVHLVMIRNSTDLVGEGNLEGVESIIGVLDEFGAGGGHPKLLGLNTTVDLREPGLDSGLVEPEDNGGGMEKVVYRRPFPRKFGVHRKISLKSHVLSSWLTFYCMYMYI